jgi:hypothetical protein
MDDDLFVSVYDDIFWKVNFTSESEFFIREYRGYLRFQTGDDNKVNGFILRAGIKYSYSK